jgi:hypothetical protein
MNLSLAFWKKSKPEPRVFEIPEDHVRRVRELDDAYQKAEFDRAAHYDLWAYIAGLIPEVNKGSWHLDFGNALKVRVVERIKA